MAKRQPPQPAPPDTTPQTPAPAAARARTRKTPEAGAAPARGRSTAQEPDQERIARRAYELYERRGGEHGRHEDDWYQAEREVRGPGAQDGGAGKPTAGRPRARTKGQPPADR